MGNKIELPPIPSAWLFPATLSVAKNVQSLLADKVITIDHYDKIECVSGIDVSNNLYDPLQMVYAAVVSLTYTSLRVIEVVTVADQQTFPYQPGFLGFREVPIILKAIAQLKQKPDILLVDGHGISHPRRFGVATHLGVLLDIPTIGVAKSILIGKPAADLGSHVGDKVPLVWHGHTIGILLRSKKRCNPLIISIGHKVSLDSALQIVMQCLTTYRLPEPTRFAHQEANKFRVSFRPNLQLLC